MPACPPLARRLPAACPPLARRLPAACPPLARRPLANLRPRSHSKRKFKSEVAIFANPPRGFVQSLGCRIVFSSLKRNRFCARSFGKVTSGFQQKRACALAPPKSTDKKII